MNSRLFVGLLLTALLAPAWLASAAQTPPAKKSPPAAPVETPIPQSVFVIPASPREGRNPFFPRSAGVQQVPKPGKETSVETASIVLNGVVPSGPRRTAMINGRTFEKGEENEIKLPNGAKVLIKCEDIKEDSVTILVNGTQRRELRLRMGL